MSNDTTPTPKPGMTEALDKLYLELQDYPVVSDNFALAMAHIETLEKLKLSEKEGRFSKLETVLPVLGNLAGIVAILGFEHAHVITSKALGFVLKSKV